MVSRQDVEKRRAWEVRFGRFRASGLTIARFCEQEHVSMHTFYYWAKRVGSNSVRPSRRRTGKRVAAESPVREARGHSRQDANAALVRFSWNAGGGGVGAGRLPGRDSLSRRVPPARAGGTPRRIPGSRREFMTGKARTMLPSSLLSPLGQTKIYLYAKPLDMRKSFDGLHAIVQSEFLRDIRCGRCVSVSQPPPGSHQADPLGSGRLGDLDEAFGTRHLPEAARHAQRTRRSRWTPPTWRCCSRGLNWRA